MNESNDRGLKAALHTIRRLRAEGYLSLFAGGCVRDRLLRTSPTDYDVATDATPEQIKEVFPRARQVGAKFGVMLVRSGGCDTEVATFRSDGPYSDGRHPDSVTFGSAKEDAKRRDFTINGLFYDPIENRLIDYVEGRRDLESGIIRTIGDPQRRFGEDHLRMLRAVRFAARLGFQIERATLEAIQTLAHHLSEISAERVWMELELILTDSSRASGWSLLLETGLRSHLALHWPACARRDMMDQSRLAAFPVDRIGAALALAGVWCEYAVDQLSEICRDLRLSNRLTSDVAWLTRSLPSVSAHSNLDLADLKLLMAHTLWPELLELLRAQLVAGGDRQDAYCELQARSATIAPEEVAPPPFVTGDDLLGMGVSAGPHFGMILNQVYRAQLNGLLATSEDAVKMVRSLIDDLK